MAEGVKPALRVCRMKANAHVLCFMLLLLALFLASPVSATVFTYDGKGNTGSIQDLINTTTNGDSIYLAGGTYYENLQINRSIVFGALNSNDPPEIVSSNASEAGITLASDGITLNGVIISGDAGHGLLVKSNNNQVRAITVRGMSRGIGLKSAISNIFSGNTIINNSLGIDIDRSSRSNTFYLNYLNNTRDVEVQSAENIWSSGRQVYQYAGRDFTGQVGNFWSGYTGVDTNGDGIGDEMYTIQSDIPGPNINSGGSGGIIDRAPLISQPQSYTLVSIASPFNTSRLAGGFQSPEFLGGLQQQQGNQPLSSSPSPAENANPSDLRNPLFPFLVQYWWVIPIALIICVIAGIWFERKWKRREPVAGDNNTLSSSRNVTVVKKTLPADADGEHDQLHYAAHLPPALERRYPDAEYIAEGGVSRVFRAWDEKEGREVAVKIPIRFDEVTGTQFTKELHVWEGLHHKNIVEIYAANIFPVPYIEMEYVKSALASMKFPLETKQAVEIVKGVAEGLRYAHEQGIVHRDIKPGNIMITPEGIPKISDWGLSKAEGTRQSGFIGFSLEYAAPEQLAPNMYGEPGPGTDIYQLGVLFYEMLAGDVPFRGGGMGEVTHAILHDDPVPLVPEGTDAALIREIIAKCMAKEPKNRYGSVSLLLDDLKRIRS
jgi:eukaryotic-like serine/threonine-protein kinase